MAVGTGQPLEPCRARAARAPRAGLAGAGPSTTHAAFSGDATNTFLCTQDMQPNSIIYTVFANDSDTGNSSKVSYSIEEVSMGLSPNTLGTALAKGQCAGG